MIVPWLLAAPAVVAAAITSINLATWPTGRPNAHTRRVSVLFPARNEAAHIGPAVTTALANGVHEVLVYDDSSTDATAAIAEAAGAKVIPGVPLPVGWVGKVHACHQLARHATGDVLLFVDADVRLERDGAARMVDLLTRWQAQVATAVPHQHTGTWLERWVLPLLHVTYTSWLPLVLIPWIPDPRILAANGQLLAVERTAYDAMGGFAAVSSAVVDDMAFCARAKSTGHRVVFADGERVASCRMYRSAREVWEGFSKNVYPGLNSPLLLAVVVALYLTAFVLPTLGLLASPLLPDAWRLACFVAVGANLGQRVALAVRHRHPWDTVVAQAPATLALIAIALNSWRWARNRSIHWRGRVYPGVSGA